MSNDIKQSVNSTIKSIDKELREISLQVLNISINFDSYTKFLQLKGSWKPRDRRQ